MAELRWALFGLGALFVAGLALWEWRRTRRGPSQTSPEIAVPTMPASFAVNEDRARRVEPRIDNLEGTQESPAEGAQTSGRKVPVIHPAEQLTVPVSSESAVDRPGGVKAAPPQPAAPAVRWPPDRADKVLTLRLVNAQGALLQGRQVRLALEQAGLAHGPQNIYHRCDPQGAVLVSAANLLRPGDLDPVQIDEQQLRGLSLFSVLPGALPPVRMLEELVAVARAVAWRLGAAVQDDHGAELTGERLVQLRCALPDAAEHGSA